MRRETPANLSWALSRRARVRYAPRVPPANLKRQAALWLGGAVIVAILLVCAALVFLSDFDVLARNYSVL